MQNDLKDMYRALRARLAEKRLPAMAKAEKLNDGQGLPEEDPGPERAVAEGVAWLLRAQEFSRSQDGGVARHYSLLSGWGSSYPETTGYIIPTLLDHAHRQGDEHARGCARRMLDWLVSIQQEDGSFVGGTVDEKDVGPVVFDTGQILFGLARGAEEFQSGRCHQAMVKAADWLVKVQDPQGTWLQTENPYAIAGGRAFETHVAWGLLQAASLEPEKPYARAALRNVNWVLGLQRENGWFAQSCLSDHARPLTHLLGYVLRGVLEAYLYSQDSHLLKAAKKTADALLLALHTDGFLAGRLDSAWQEAVSWACLTGSVQIALCWQILYECTGEEKYLQAAWAANKYVRRTMKTEGSEETRGAIKGSFPVWGGYCPYQYVNWACKFFVDSNMREIDLRKKTANINDHG